jgi:polysaccharide deacetylase 2 family uncharacterized protein YibQ
MENTFSKTMISSFIFTTLIVFGYIAGLITFPAPKEIIAIKKSTMSIENAEDKAEPNNNNSATPLSPFQVREINPFNSGKVLDIPRSNNNVPTQQDKRITIVPHEESLNENPMGYTSDKVEIEISGEETQSQIEAPNMLDDLSIMSQNKKRTEKNPDVGNKDINISDPYAPRTPLGKSPQNGYTEKSSFGMLPKSPIGQKPLWQVYANPTTINPDKRPIAYVLGGLGTDYKLTVEAIKTLPSEITLGFIPYVNNLQSLIDMAREYGHETILEIPMESHDFPRSDAGVLALKTQDTPQEYRTKLQTLLSRATGYSGVMNYLGSKYILDDTVSLTLLNDLKQYGLYFVENKTIRSGILSEIAKPNNIPYGASFDIIDEALSPSLINTNFDVIEKNALNGTPLIATAYLSPLSLSLLRTRIMAYKNNTQNDIQLIPISAYIKGN